MRSNAKAPVTAEPRLARRVRRIAAGVIAQYIQDLTEQAQPDPCTSAA